MTEDARVQSAVVGNGQVVVQRTAREQKRKEVHGRPQERVNGQIEGNVVENGGATGKLFEGGRETRHCVRSKRQGRAFEWGE